MEVVSNMPTLKDGKIELPADFADIHNQGYGTHARLEGLGEKSVDAQIADRFFSG